MMTDENKTPETEKKPLTRTQLLGRAAVIAGAVLTLILILILPSMDVYVSFGAYCVDEAVDFFRDEYAKYQRRQEVLAMDGYEIRSRAGNFNRQLVGSPHNEKVVFEAYYVLRSPARTDEELIEQTRRLFESCGIIAEIKSDPNYNEPEKFWHTQYTDVYIILPGRQFDYTDIEEMEAADIKTLRQNSVLRVTFSHTAETFDNCIVEFTRKIARSGSKWDDVL